MDMLVTRGIDRTSSPSSSFLPRDDDIIELLKSSDFDTRLQTLNRMILLCKRDVDWFSKFSKKGDLMKNVDRILGDDRWEVQHQAIRFLLEAMPSFGTNLEYCMVYVLPKLVPKLGSSKITIRRVTVQTLQNFTRLQPDALPTLGKMIVNYLVTSTDRLVKFELLNELPTLYQDYLREANWNNLVEGILKWMGGLQDDRDTVERAAMIIKKLEVFVGEESFEHLIEGMNQPEQGTYKTFVKDLHVPSNDVVLSDASTPSSLTRSASKSGREPRTRFGIIPSYIGTMLQDDDPNTKTAALEKLKTIVEKMTADEMAKFIPHLHSFFVSIGNVLNDLNLKVVLLALDLLRITINRLKGNVEAHLHQVVTLLSRHLGNQKAVVKQLLMMSVMDLFRSLNPKAVAGVLCPFLEHKNSRVLNMLTASLLVVPRDKMNLTVVANILVPRLVDPKRRVRLAAFELLSVLAFSLNGKLDPIIKLVKEYEERAFEGLSAAVFARLRRGTRPSIRYDGLLEYSTPPATDSSFDVDDESLTLPNNLDLHWILYANGGERPNSPPTLFSSYKSVVKGAMAEEMLARQKALWESESEKDDVSMQSMNMERQKSDDVIARRPTGEYVMGSGASRSSSATVRPSRQFLTPLSAGSHDRIVFDRKRQSLQNPSSSSNSWSSPLQKAQRTSVELERNPFAPDAEKSNRIANGTKARKEGEGKKKLSLDRTKSEKSLREERKENLPLPTAPSPQDYTEGMGSSTVKAASHHSLPLSHSTASRQHSQPIAKTFLKAGSNNRVKPPSLKGPPVLAPRQATQAIIASEKVQGSTSVSTALKKMDMDDWNEKVEGIQMVSTISERNPQAIVDSLTEVTNAVLNECKNLRSSVSRVAIVCIGTMHANLKTKMDPVTEKTSAVLMTRSGDVSSAFIRDDALEAMESVVRNANPTKVLNAIVASGAKSKNNTIRTVSSSLVSQLLNRIGPSAALQNGDFLSKLIPLLILFSKDCNPKVRQHAKLALLSLSKDSSFDRQMRKFVTEGELNSVREIIGDVNKKGGMDALESSSSSIFSRNGSVRKSVSRKIPDHLQMDLDEIKEDLNASGWERRLAGLKRFEEMVSTSAKAAASHTSLIEAFIARLSDINSKVSLAAMSTYMLTLPKLAKFYSSEASLKAVLNQLLLSLASHLPSRSEEHRHLAQSALQETIAHVDATALSSHLAAVTKKANVKQRPFLLHLFTKLNSSLYPSKPKQVEVTALPILFEYLKSPAADVDNKKALSEYARGLQRLMGEKSLSDATLSLDPTRKKTLDALLH